MAASFGTANALAANGSIRGAQSLMAWDLANDFSSGGQAAYQIFNSREVTLGSGVQLGLSVLGVGVTSQTSIFRSTVAPRLNPSNYSWNSAAYSPYSRSFQTNAGINPFPDYLGPQIPKVTIAPQRAYQPGARMADSQLLRIRTNTNRTLNLTEWRRTISRNSIATERTKFLGTNAVKIDSGTWRSLDGTRQFRTVPSDYLGQHGIGQPRVPNIPHVHFEFLAPPNPGGANLRVLKNVHVPLSD